MTSPGRDTSLSLSLLPLLPLQVMVSYLRLVANPGKDSVALDVAINTPSRGLGA
jgi:hypothetical protein